MNINQDPQKKGFALLAVIWVVAFLSMVMTVTLLLVKVEAESVASDVNSFRAWQLAHTGLSYAVHPDVKRGDTILISELENTDESYQVSIKAEASKINLNYILKVKDKPLLRNILNHWLRDQDKANQLADALVDWVDGDDLVSLNGAEKDWYQSKGFQNRPFNRDFQSLDEVRLVKGFNEVEKLFPEWRSWLTLYSEGAIDIHEVNAETLSVVAETELENAQQFVADINGEDGILGTSDDQRYASIEIALKVLASRPSNQNLISKRFILQGKTLNIESVGRSGIYKQSIQAIVRKSSSAPRVLLYKETILESE